MVFRGLAFLLTALVMATTLARADTPPVLSESDAPLTFAVLGDTHYAAPEFKIKEAIHRLGDEIRAQHPEVAFVCHTGDVVEGGTHRTTETGTRTYAPAGYEEMKRELAFATRDLREALGRPVFIAVGNHDKHDPGGKAFREVVLPQIEKELGQPVRADVLCVPPGQRLFRVPRFRPARSRSRRQNSPTRRSKRPRRPGRSTSFCSPTIRCGRSRGPGSTAPR